MVEEVTFRDPDQSRLHNLSEPQEPVKPREKSETNDPMDVSTLSDDSEIISTAPLTTQHDAAPIQGPKRMSKLFRWFKLTLKPPYTVASGNLSSAIWDTSHWTSFVKFGLKTA